MAGTTADKLAKLQSTKADIKAAIQEMGQSVGDVFDTYPDKIRAISSFDSGETFSMTVASGETVSAGDAVLICAEDGQEWECDTGLSWNTRAVQAEHGVQLNSTTFLCPYRNSTNPGSSADYGSNAYLMILKVSGETATWTGTQIGSSSSIGYDFSEMYLVKLSSSRVLVVLEPYSSSGKPKCCVVSISGTTISAGSWVETKVTGSILCAYLLESLSTSTSKKIMLVCYASSKQTACVITANTSTKSISCATATQVGTSSGVGDSLLLSDGRILISLRDGDCCIMKSSSSGTITSFQDSVTYSVHFGNSLAEVRPLEIASMYPEFSTDYTATSRRYKVGTSSLTAIGDSDEEGVFYCSGIREIDLTVADRFWFGSIIAKGMNSLFMFAPSITGVQLINIEGSVASTTYYPIRNYTDDGVLFVYSASDPIEVRLIEKKLVVKKANGGYPIGIAKESGSGGAEIEIASLGG